MPFVIIQEIRTKNSTVRNYFQEAIGIMKMMVVHPENAQQYSTNTDAHADRVKHFGNRPGFKVVTYGTDQSMPGVIVHGHESGIF